MSKKKDDKPAKGKAKPKAAPKPALTVQPEASAALSERIAKMNAMSAKPEPKPKKPHPMTVKRKPAEQAAAIEKIVEKAQQPKADKRKVKAPKIFEAPELEEGQEQKELSARQKHFCQNLLANGYNATKAAKDAGYSHKGARTQASELLTNPNILRYLEELQRPVVEALDLSAERILREYASMAFGNDHDFVKKDENGNVVVDDNGLPLPDFTGVTRDQMAGLAGLEITILPSFNDEDPNPLKIKWKRADKKAALDVLAKRAGVIVDKVKVEGHVTMAYAKEDLDEIRKAAMDAVAKAMAHED
jgi:phage terminase small subunit